MDIENQLDEAKFKEMRRAYKLLPYGAQRVAQILEVLVFASKLCPNSHASALYDLIWAYGLGDDPAKSLPICAEFFALLEQYPDKIDGKSMAPSAAMIANVVAMSLPQIPLSQCKSLLDQFACQVKAYGIGERLWQLDACNYYAMTGDIQKAQKHMKLFYSTPRDSISDCKACEASNAAECLLNMNMREEARALLQPVLDGSLTCEQQPWSSLSKLIHDALDHAEQDYAIELGRHLSRRAIRSCNDIPYIGALLRLRSIKDLDGGIEYLQKGIRWSIGLWDQSLLFDFYRGAYAFCQKLAQTQQKIPMRLPKKIAFWQADGIYDSETLADWFYAQLKDIATRFDSRNGTKLYSEKLIKE